MREMAVIQSDNTPGSPCNNNCYMDSATRLCMGCLRTINEIIRWQLLSSEEKKEILKLIEVRRVIAYEKKPS
jgi:hypothetical protein